MNLGGVQNAVHVAYRIVMEISGEHLTWIHLTM